MKLGQQNFRKQQAFTQSRTQHVREAGTVETPSLGAPSCCLALLMDVLTQGFLARTRTPQF